MLKPSTDQLRDDIIVIADPNHQAVVLHAMELYRDKCAASERLTLMGRNVEAENVIIMMRKQLIGGTINVRN